jgi:hypothetical protein
MEEMVIVCTRLSKSGISLLGTPPGSEVSVNMLHSRFIVPRIRYCIQRQQDIDSHP